MTDKPVLEPEEVATVLGSDAADDPSAGPPTDGPIVYSLRRPVAIAPDAEPIARTRLERLATAVAEAITRELATEVTIEIQGFKQEQTAAAVGSLQQPAWLLSFMGAESGGMTLGLAPACALSLVELALGGAGNASDGERDPTPLESRVLENLCTALAPVLSRRCGAPFDRGLFTSGSVPSAVASPGQTVGVAVLKLTIAGSERSGLLLATPDLLLPRDGADGDGAVHRPMAIRLDSVPVSTRPVLRAGRMRLSDLSALEPGAVLRFETAAGDEIELRVAGQPVFRGHLTRHEDSSDFEVSWRRGRATADQELAMQETTT